MAEDLATRLRDGDPACARDLWDAYGRLVHAVCWKVLGDRSLAEDATQQTFLQAWRSREAIEPGRDVRPWLCTIAKRCAIDLHRRESRRSHEPIEPAGGGRTHPALIDTPDLEAAWTTWRVREAIGRLPEEERVVVTLQHGGGLTHPQIADRLAVPIGTVKSRSFRAHRRLAGALANLEEVR